MPTPASESAVRAEPARDEVLSPAELSAVIEKFSELDWLRAKKAALRFYSRCGGDWEVFQNEALVRALDGRRKCHKSVGVVTFLGNVIRSVASERDGLDFERNVSWTDPAKQIREKIARMDDLFMDDLFSMTDDELLQEATEQGVDVEAVGSAGRKAFERARVLVDRNRLIPVRGGIGEDAGRAPVAYDRAKARSRLGPVAAENRKSASKLVQEGGEGSTHDAPFSAEPSFAEYLATDIGLIRRQFLVVFSVLLLTVGLAVAYLHTTPPRYTAKARILIDTERFRFRANRLSVKPAQAVDSQIEALKSENFALAVIKKLHLTEDPEFIGSNRGLLGNLIHRLLHLASSKPKSEIAPEQRALRVFQKRLTVSRVGMTLRYRDRV